MASSVSVWAPDAASMKATVGAVSPTRSSNVSASTRPPTWIAVDRCLEDRDHLEVERYRPLLSTVTVDRCRRWPVAPRRRVVDTAIVARAQVVERALGDLDARRSHAARRVGGRHQRRLPSSVTDSRRNGVTCSTPSIASRSLDEVVVQRPAVAEDEEVGALELLDLPDGEVLHARAGDGHERDEEDPDQQGVGGGRGALGVPGGVVDGQPALEAERDITGRSRRAATDRDASGRRR